MSRALKQNNVHKPRPVVCRDCERDLPKRAHRDRCATCIKRETQQVLEYFGKALET